MDIASEYRYRDPVVGPGDLVIGDHPVGRDRRHARRDARWRASAGRAVLAITNVVGSQATRDADGVLFTRAGLEIGVAATKTFVCQVAVMYLLALRLAELRGTLKPSGPAGGSSSSSSACRRCIESVVASAEARRRADRRALRDARSSSSTSAATSGCPGRARGRAEAQGDLLHLDRRLRGGRDEARPDRPARRVDAGRLRGHRLAGARQGRLQHAGGARARGAT